MGLKGANPCIRELRNDRDEPKGLGLLAHLILSGHTHVAYPAGPLSTNASDIYQGLLAPNQLQLVGGSLMLNKDLSGVKAAVIAPPAPEFAWPETKYSIAAKDIRNCQAQILRLFSDTENPGQLVMFRTPVWSEDGSIYDVDETSKPVRFAFDAAAPLAS
jgi:hypothetical protein